MRANLLTTSLHEQFGDSRGSIAERVAYAHDSNLMPEEEAWDEYNMNPRIQMFQHDSVLVGSSTFSNDTSSMKGTSLGNFYSYRRLKAGAGVRIFYNPDLEIKIFGSPMPSLER